MPGLPAHCEHCGNTFISAAIFVGGGARNITFTGNQVTCTRCGKFAQAIDGTFDFEKEAIKVRSATPRTLAILRVLQRAAAAVEAGQDAEVIITELEQESPEFAAAVRSVTGRYGSRILSALLIFILVTNCTMKTQANLDWNELIDQVHWYVTGGETYPVAGQQGETQSGSEQTPKPSRQQRRLQERRSKKQQQRTERQKAARRPLRISSRYG